MTAFAARNCLLGDGLYDFAVSRAYYAMLYSAEALLLQQDLRFSSHGAVIAAFGQRFAKPEVIPRRFHHYLIDAQDSRVQGDYDIRSTQTADDAGLAINRAHEFIRCTDDFLTSHDRPASKRRSRKK